MITEAMVKAGVRAYSLTWRGSGPTGETFEESIVSSVRAAIEAALEAQWLPTDADIDVAIGRLIDVCTDDEDDYAVVDGELTNRIENAEGFLFYLIAKRKEAARREGNREALEAVRDFMEPWYQESTDDSEADAYGRVAREIDIRLNTAEHERGVE